MLTDRRENAMVQILGQKSFAVLLVNFTDSATPKPFTLAQAEDAWDRIRRYWQYDSYDKVNLNGSQVFDWQTYPSKRAAFTKANSDTKGNPNRGMMINSVKSNLGVDTSAFDHLIIIFSEQVGDAWTPKGVPASIFEPAIIATSTICHEMTHQFGEDDHSWDFTNRIKGGGPGEYYDQTDIMSAQNCWRTTETVDAFSGSGPHHCMFWKDRFGWLDDTTITRIRDTDLNNGYDQTFTLFSRNEPVVERLNCIQFLDIWVELNVNTDKGVNVFYDNFDTGLQGSGVVIHQQKEHPTSPGKMVPYVCVPDMSTPTKADQKFWSAGQIHTRTESTPQPGVEIYVWVQSVDLVEGSAKVNISSIYPPPLTRHRIVAIRKARTSAGVEYISHVGILNDSGAVVPLSRGQVVTRIENKRNCFYVQGSDNSQAEVVVEKHWIKTRPDSNLADNLLSLPSF